MSMAAATLPIWAAMAFIGGSPAIARNPN